MKLTGREAGLWLSMALVDNRTIVEHRPGNETVPGRVHFISAIGDTSFAISWKEIQGGERSTVFTSNLWEIEVVEERIIFIWEVGRGTEAKSDGPWKGTTLYTIFLHN